MTDTDVDWVLDQIRNEYGAGSLPAGVGGAGDDPPPLQYIDRGEMEDADGTPERRKGELTQGNIVSAAAVDGSESPIGTEYDLDVERVVNVRLEGLTAQDEYGYVDPDGVDGAQWEPLKRVVRRALYRQRTFPDTGRPNTGYTDLQLTNPAEQSDNYADYYRWEVDVVFDGFETLP